jgi:hypothetical protein
MKTEAEVVDELARAWLAEAKRLRSTATCSCGTCDEVIQTSETRFVPGHDAKLLSRYKAEIRAILSGLSPLSLKV